MCATQPRGGDSVKRPQRMRLIARKTFIPCEQTPAQGYGITKDACLMFNVSCLMLVDHEAKIDNTRHECPEAWMFQTFGVMFEDKQSFATVSLSFNMRASASAMGAASVARRDARPLSSNRDRCDIADSTHYHAVTVQ